MSIMPLGLCDTHLATEGLEVVQRLLKVKARDLEKEAQESCENLKLPECLRKPRLIWKNYQRLMPTKFVGETIYHTVALNSI